MDHASWITRATFFEIAVYRVMGVVVIVVIDVVLSAVVDFAAVIRLFDACSQPTNQR